MTNTKPVEGELAIYTPEEMEKLIAFLWDQRGDMTVQSTLLYVVLGAFAGLRPAEASGLDWKDIDFTKNEIHLTASVAKIARTVPIHLNLQAFLQPYKSRKGLVVIHKKVTNLLRGNCDEAGVTHIPNGLRRSYGAYRRVEAVPEVIQAEMGALASSEPDQARKLPTAASAAKYWAILP